MENVHFIRLFVGEASLCFLLPQRSITLSVDNFRCGFLDSPYTDKYGNQDPLLTRGDAMYLHDETYKKLNQILLSGKNGIEIVRTSERLESYIPRAL